MTTISVRDLQKQIRSVMDTAQHDQVVITRIGQPIAVVVGVEGADWETVAIETNRSFWKEIAQRRNQETISLAEIRSRLGALPAKPAGSRSVSDRALVRRLRCARCARLEVPEEVSLAGNWTLA